MANDINKLPNGTRAILIELRKEIEATIKKAEAKVAAEYMHGEIYPEQRRLAASIMQQELMKAADSIK